MNATPRQGQSWFRKIPYMAGLILSILVCTIILVVGSIVGSKHTTSEPPVNDQDSELHAVQSAETPANGGIATTSREFGSALAELATISSGFDRSVAVDGLIDSSTFEDIVSLLEESMSVEDFAIRAEVQDKAFGRLASINPKQALSQANSFPLLLRNQFTSAIFAEWSLSDINAAIAFGRSFVHELETSQKIAVLSGIFEANPYLTESAKQEITNGFELTEHETTLLEQASDASVGDEPLEAWNSILADTLADFDQTSELADVALAAIAKEGIEVFVGMHASLEDRRTRNEVFRIVLRENLAKRDIASAFEQAVRLLDDTNRTTVFEIAEEWARNDPSATLDALKQVSDPTLQEHLRGEILLVWARSDADAALRAMAELPQNEKRNKILAEALWVWAGRDPRNVLQRLDSLPDELQEMARERAVGMLAHIAPQEATTYLSSLGNLHSRQNLARDIVWKWAQQDAQAALEWLLTESEVQEFRIALVSQMQSSLSVENVESLIEIAVSHPPNAAGVGYEGALLAKFCASDVETAKALLSKVREGRSRLLVQVAIGSRFLIDDDPNAALDFGRQLPDAQRAEYEGMVVAVWATHEPLKAYDYVDQLSSPEAKSRAAMWLSAYSKSHNIFSSSQMEVLGRYLTDEEKKELQAPNLWADVLGF